MSVCGRELYTRTATAAHSQPGCVNPARRKPNLKPPPSILALHRRVAPSGIRLRPRTSRSRRSPPCLAAAAAAAEPAEPAGRPQSQLRLIQHKREAYWFYRFLSIVYDKVVNPGHWTEEMREAALDPAKLEPDHKVYDVGAGTGFTTLGVVAAGVKPANVTMIDQSPHQLAKAKAKADLAEVTKLEGDAEDLPFDTDSADRYVSAGSIEYWPEPQRGICEAYRVIKPGGMACMIGPVHPTFWLSRIMADFWMLFPTEQEYIDWFTKAGFTDVKMTRIGPKWYEGERCHGLIMGCSVTGIKPDEGESPLKLGPKTEDVSVSRSNPLTFVLRVILGSLAGFYYVLVPVYMWIIHFLKGRVQWRAFLTGVRKVLP